MRILKSNPLLGLANSYLVDSPQPSTLSYFWNFGSLLGLTLILQILTGIFLAMHYNSSAELAFVSVEHIMRDVNYGWLLRYLHANGASFFFIWMYLHIARGLYYSSYKAPRVLLWSIGVIILIVTIVTAFLGYCLPYGQMSHWGIFEMPYMFYNKGIALPLLISFWVFICVILKNGNIAKRIVSYLRIGPHNKDIISIIFGTLLGDGYAEKRILGKGTKISFYQEKSHKHYLLWLHLIVSNLGYCSQIVPRVLTRWNTKGELRFYLRFHTYTYSSLNWVYESWYINGIKRVPLNIQDYFTPLALAIWSMDDGSKAGSGFKFSTNSFTHEDCIFLTKVLYRSFNIKANVHSAGVKNEYVIYILSESMPLFRNIVTPFFVPSMLYKLV